MLNPGCDFFHASSLPQAPEVSPRQDSWPVWDDAAARFFADGLRQSDYGNRVGGALCSLLGKVSSLLDIGAGSGVLGQRLTGNHGRWIALGPKNDRGGILEHYASSSPERIGVIRDLWKNLTVSPEWAHEVVLAANTPGPWDDPRRFLRTLRPLAQRVLCWVVPAQQGPRHRCLSGFLPPELHGEDGRPGVELILERFSPDERPDEVRFVTWTFRYCFADFTAAERHFRDCLGVDRDAHPLARQLRTHLEKNLTTTPDGLLASAPKRSALLLWNVKGGV
jgi:hypothetical protein